LKKTRGGADDSLEQESGPATAKEAA
jgi:hypothetical protein